MKVCGIYHTSIPADDLDRVEKVYTEVLGLESTGARPGGGLSRLKCGDVAFVLFKRPKPLKRDSLEEDGVYHQAFELHIAAFDEGEATLREAGLSHRIIGRDSGQTIILLGLRGGLRGSARQLLGLGSRCRRREGARSPVVPPRDDTGEWLRLLRVRVDVVPGGGFHEFEPAA
jgi:catechol 2,3-dioxygenase-like lactoylglutathione lyase family enzyme